MTSSASALRGRTMAPRAARRAALLVGMSWALGAALPGGATGMEFAPTYEQGPRTPFNVFGGQELSSATTPGLPATHNDGGLYVIGDSISGGVPYVDRAAADGVRSEVRSWVGWTTRFHRLVTSWDTSPLASFDEAAAGSWSAVFVQLGTNDIACLHGGVYCQVRADDTPEHLAEERGKVVAEVTAATDELLAAGKCVLWAGPRHGVSTDASDVDAFEAALDGLQAAHPGAFHNVDFDAYTASDDALRADFARPESDGVHPTTAEARAAIAELAVTEAERECGLGADPSLAAPAAAVAPPAPLPVQPDPLVADTPGTGAAPGGELLAHELPSQALPIFLPPTPKPRCPGLRSSGAYRACARALAVTSCHAAATRTRATACMVRVRRLYGPSAPERRALARCAKASRAKTARACEASVRHRFRAR
jgi:hypothetical protein